jgi:hypothetical protein
MYVSGGHDYLISRIWSLSTGISDINSYISEAQNDLALGNLTSGHRGQIDYILRLKKFQIDRDPSGLSIPTI